MQKATIHITGMHCSGCEQFISRVLQADGIKECTVDRKSGEAKVSFDEKIISVDQISALINESETYHVDKIISLT